MLSDYRQEVWDQVWKLLWFYWTKRPTFPSFPERGSCLAFAAQRRRWTKCWNARSQDRTNTIIWRNQSCFQREKGRNHHLKAPLLSRNVVRFPEEPHGVWIPHPRKIGEPSSSVTHVLQKVQPRAAREMIYILALLYTPGLPKIWENWI